MNIVKNVVDCVLFLIRERLGKILPIDCLDLILDIINSNRYKIFLEGFTHIGASTFFCCKNLTHIEIPNSVTRIGDYAFRECMKLTKIKIPKSIVYVGDYAFYNCTELTQFEIPNSFYRNFELVKQVKIIKTIGRQSDYKMVNGKFYRSQTLKV